MMKRTINQVYSLYISTMVLLYVSKSYYKSDIYSVFCMLLDVLGKNIYSQKVQESNFNPTHSYRQSS